MCALLPVVDSQAKPSPHYDGASMRRQPLTVEDDRERWPLIGLLERTQPLAVRATSHHSARRLRTATRAHSPSQTDERMRDGGWQTPTHSHESGGLGPLQPMKRSSGSAW
jgi:hypothetical protein